MISDSFVCGKLASDIVPDARELSLRLRLPEGAELSSMEKCRGELQSALDIKYVGAKVEVSYPAHNVSDIGFGPIASRLMYEKLKNCKSAFVFAVTLGHGVDRLLKKLSVTSVYEHYITDALASAYAEKACDMAQDIIRGEISCYNRFSPGYGDIPLGIQPQILELLGAGKYASIAIGGNLLMSPIKSITAVMGIKE